MNRLGLAAILLLTACVTAPMGTPASGTSVAQPTRLASDTPARLDTPAPAETQSSPTPQPSPTTEPGGTVPYPDAPLCADTGEAHDHSLFHTLWDGARGCHYDHEHGQNPFTPEVAAAFPDFDLLALLGGVGVGHTNPSSPMENTHKHGGMKWNVQLTHPEGCQGFEGARNGVNGSAIQYHNFGDYSVELEGRIHSTVALLRLCSADDPTDYGYIYVVQFQDYGQVVVPYQGTVFPYPHSPDPDYPSPFGPYLSVNCIGEVSQCRASLEVAQRNRASSNWTSKPTGSGVRPEVSRVFRLLFRIEDTYQNFDWNDQDHPFTFVYLCTADGGVTYDPAGCRYNNSTTQVHEIAGEIPAEWDNLAGFDADSRVGRVTAEGYLTRFGQLNSDCTQANTDGDCFPIKMVNAFVGTYGSVLVFTEGKGTNTVPVNSERDIFFCNGRACAEGDAGAVASGWIGPNN